MDSPHYSNSAHHQHRSRPLSHAQAAQALAGGKVSSMGSSVDPDDEIDSGCSDDEEGGSITHHPLMEEELTNSAVYLFK